MQVNGYRQLFVYQLSSVQPKKKKSYRFETTWGWDDKVLGELLL